MKHAIVIVVSPDFDHPEGEELPAALHKRWEVFNKHLRSDGSWVSDGVFLFDLAIEMPKFLKLLAAAENQRFAAKTMLLDAPPEFIPS